MPTALADREAKRAERVEASFAVIRDHYTFDLSTLHSMKSIVIWKGEQFGYHGTSLDLFVDALMQKLGTYAEERELNDTLAQREKEELRAVQPAKKPREKRPFVVYNVSVMFEPGQHWEHSEVLARDAREARKLVSRDCLAIGYAEYKIHHVKKWKAPKVGQVFYY